MAEKEENGSEGHHHHKSSHSVPHDNSRKMLYTLVIVLIITNLLFLGYILLATGKVPDNVYKKVKVENVTMDIPKIRNVTENVSQEITFRDAMQHPREYHKQERTVVGFLWYRYFYDEDNSIGRYEYYIVDDYGSTIRLEGLNRTQQLFFEKDKKSDRPYEITGTFRRLYPGFKIDVDRITPTERPVHQVTRQVIYNETIVEKKQVYVNVTLSSPLSLFG